MIIGLGVDCCIYLCWMGILFLYFLFPLYLLANGFGDWQVFRSSRVSSLRFWGNEDLVSRSSLASDKAEVFAQRCRPEYGAQGKGCCSSDGVDCIWASGVCWSLRKSWLGEGDMVERILGIRIQGVAAVQLVGGLLACSSTGEVCTRAKTNTPKGFPKTFKEHLSQEGETKRTLM